MHGSYHMALRNEKNRIRSIESWLFNRKSWFHSEMILTKLGRISSPLYPKQSRFYPLLIWGQWWHSSCGASPPIASAIFETPSRHWQQRWLHSSTIWCCIYRSQTLSTGGRKEQTSSETLEDLNFLNDIWYIIIMRYRHICRQSGKGSCHGHVTTKYRGSHQQAHLLCGTRAHIKPARGRFETCE